MQRFQNTLTSKVTHSRRATSMHYQQCGVSSALRLLFVALYLNNVDKLTGNTVLHNFVH